MQLSTGKTECSQQGRVQTGTIELRALLFLNDLFRERRWANPQYFKIDSGTTGSIY